MPLTVSVVVALSLTMFITKRFLVPYGEYTPLLIQYAPEWVKRWTNTPAGGGFAAGREAVSYNFDLGKGLTPDMFLSAYRPSMPQPVPEAVARCSSTFRIWPGFHKSDCGRQMVAFSVLRAIENRRYFVFGCQYGTGCDYRLHRQNHSIHPARWCDTGAGQVWLKRPAHIFYGHLSIIYTWNNISSKCASYRVGKPTPGVSDNHGQKFQKPSGTAFLLSSSVGHRRQLPFFSFSNCPGQ